MLFLSLFYKSVLQVVREQAWTANGAYGFGKGRRKRSRAQWGQKTDMGSLHTQVVLWHHGEQPQVAFQYTNVSRNETPESEKAQMVAVQDAIVYIQQAETNTWRPAPSHNWSGSAMPAMWELGISIELYLQTSQIIFLRNGRHYYSLPNRSQNRHKYIRQLNGGFQPLCYTL